MNSDRCDTSWQRVRVGCEDHQLAVKAGPFSYVPTICTQVKWTKERDCVQEKQMKILREWTLEPKDEGNTASTAQQG